MGGNPTPLGPFIGGLNQLEDPRLIKDDELVECVNFDIGRSGELTARPGLKLVAANSQGNFILLGTYTTIYGTSTLIARKITGNTIMYSTDFGTTWTLSSNGASGFTANLSISQHVASGTINPMIYIVPRNDSATPASGLIWDPSAPTVLNSNAAMPRGSGSIQFKERLFIYGNVGPTTGGAYRIYYSATGDFTSWPANNFFDVGSGDGDPVMACAVLNDILYIFKTNSIWTMTYDTDPGLGTLRKINSEIGCNGPFSVAAHDNQIYFIGGRSVYSLVGYTADDIGKNLNVINLRTPSVNYITTPDFVTLMGNDVMFGVATGDNVTPFKYYMYYSAVQAWSEYKFNQFPQRFFKAVHPTTYVEYYIAHDNTASANLYSFARDVTTNGNWGDYPGNTSNLRLVTKKFSWGGMAVFKRLFWWALETEGIGSQTFNLNTRADGARDSAVTTVTTTTVPALAKAAVTNRFRTIQFIITSTTASMRLIVFGGQAVVSDKAKVEASVTA